MMALLSPKVWIGLALAALLVFTHTFVYRAGKARSEIVQAKTETKIVTAALVDEKENRKLETLRQTRVIEAQNENTKRFQASQVAIAVRDAGSQRLRDDLAAIRADMSSASAEACRARIATLTAVLADMELEGGRMAARAQGHAADALMFEQGWPK